MEKASDGSFARITRKTAEDDDEKDWGSQSLNVVLVRIILLTGGYISA
jgi:hypothetical protein